MASEGPSGILHESGQECVQEGTYGPWVVVCRRKGGKKYQRHGGAPSVLENDQKKYAHGDSGNEIRANKVIGRLNFSHRLVREAKKKLS